MSRMPLIHSLFRKRWFRVLMAVLILLTIVCIWQEVSFRRWHPAARTTGHNAVWLGHSWIRDARSDAQYRGLAQRLMQARISDLYVHAGPILGDGTIDRRRIRLAGHFIRGIKKYYPQVRIQAWIGQVEAGAGGPLHLSSEDTRAAVVRTASELLDDGFDGIHYDIEPILSGNTAFLDLLHTTHALTQKHNAVLSVATSEPEPFFGVSAVAGIVASNPGYWTQDYFLKVSREVDQVAVMCYDKAIPLPSLYGKSIAWVTSWSVRHGVNDLIIGVPTYRERTFSHWPCVENLRNAVMGVKQGSDLLSQSDRGKVGVGIYAEWTTTKTDWQTYRSLWSAIPIRR